MVRIYNRVLFGYTKEHNPFAATLMDPEILTLSEVKSDIFARYIQNKKGKKQKQLKQ